MPRVILAAYNGDFDPESKYSKTHQIAEMPLNHLGLDVEYFDVQKELPDISNRPDIRGILAWLPPGTIVQNPKRYIRWLIDASERGQKIVIMGEPGFYQDENDSPTPAGLIQRLWDVFDLKDSTDWREFTYDARFEEENEDMIGFEHKPHGVDFSYFVLHKKSPKLEVFWSVVDRISDKASVLIATHPNGGYAASDYFVFIDESGDEALKKWIINPFLFFRKAFQTDDLPKLDSNTMANRRIYYSHIDGDGWNNYTHIQAYNKPRKPVISAQVIYEQAIKKYPDLPVTVTAIGADLDLKWVARKESGRWAKNLFSLPHVEMGSHTYSHPFSWEFFKEGDAEKEIPFLKFFPSSTWRSNPAYAWFKDKLNEEKKYDPDKLVDKFRKSYHTPRAFAKEPFSIEKEITGSVELINQFAPKKDGKNTKKVEVVMWSGNTSPFERALELVAENGLVNINGGDARFDKEYPSLAYVSPIGRKVGPYQQIYASNSNENTYTDLWTGRFHGFGFLVTTIENTETPWRLKPLNIYYHMYSGEKQAALNALLDNLNYARTQEITPIEASHFSKLAAGFFTGKIIKLGKNKFKIKNRGELQTLRFDDAVLKQVDFKSSKGIVGQKHYQGSLYVYFDRNIKEPVVNLKSFKNYWAEPKLNEHNRQAYLIDSRWLVWNLKQKNKKISFITQGFGDGEMAWQLPFKKFRVKVYKDKNLIWEKMLSNPNFIVPKNGIEPLEVVIDGI